MQELFPEIKDTYKISKVIKRDGRVVNFQKDKIADSIFRAAVEVGGSNRQLAEELADKVVVLLNQMYPPDATPTVEEIQDLTEKVLVENGHYITAKAYILYREEHRKLRQEKQSHIYVEDNIPYKNVWRAYIWNIDHNCDSVDSINETIATAKFQKLVDDCEQLYYQEIEKAAEAILKANPKIIIIAGPSSSGKTTTTIKIGEVLKKKNIEFVAMNLDNYFKELSQHPKDEYGDYDFETPDAIDLELVNSHLYELIQGRKIFIPEYNFKTGTRKLNAKEFFLKDNQILLIDSLHGLYPKMTSSIPHKLKFKFYIEAMCQLRDKNGEFVRWTDLRMLRRMIRDSWHRSYDPIRTVGHWHYVRRSEKKYIVPHISKVDYIFNGALGYELPIHKLKLFKYFPKIIQEYQDDPKKLDSYIRAKRVYALFESLLDIESDEIVPKNSLLREFIGGSIYNY